MLERYKNFVAPVVIEDDPEQNRVFVLVNRLLLMCIYIAVIFSFIGPFIFPVWYAPLAVCVVLVGVWFLARWTARLGRLRYFSMGLVMVMWVGTTGLVHLSGGLDNSSHALSYVTVVLVAGMLLGYKGTIVSTIMSISSLIFIVFLSTTGRLVPVHPDQTPLDELFIISSNLIVAALFLVMTWRSQKDALQKEHELAEEAISANRYKASLLASVSHELRTPLGAIMGLADMLNSGAVGEISEGQADVLKKIIYNSEYLNNLVNDFLEGSQIEAGKLTIKRIPFSPRDLARRIGAGLETHAKQKGLALSLKGEETLPDTLIGDPDRIMEVFTNLIANAIKFTESGSVTAIASVPDPSHWQVEVRDTGPGIAPENHTSIFEPFHQIRQGDMLTRKQGGVGLGLSISKKLVEMMGGTISVSSQIGVGSTFIVTLPLETSLLEKP